MNTVHIIRTGNANLASVQAALTRLGYPSELTEDPETVAKSELVILPGVGTLGATRQRLDELGLAEVIQQRARDGRPLAGVCVGLQLLLEASEESPGAEGLAILPGTARRFPASIRVPQLGWNRVEAPPEARYLRSGEAYFANSFRLSDRPPGTTVALADHGGAFVAGFERGSLLACQFHPELSGRFGAEVLRRWLEHSPSVSREVRSEGTEGTPC